MLALKRVEIPPVHEWDHNYLSKWINDIGFSEYSSIIKSSKVTGNDLMDADEDFYYDNLGCSKPNIVIKIKTELNKARK